LAEEENGLEATLVVMRTLLGLAPVLLLLVGCSSATLPEPVPEPEVIEEATPEPDVVGGEAAPTVVDQWGEWDHNGTVFLTPDLITSESPSDLVEVTFTGSEERETFDRRVNSFVVSESHIFTANFRCAPDPVEIVVNAEFSDEQAEGEAQRFAFVLGQMPLGLRGLVHEIWVHDGNEPAGGGNNSILVHSVYADESTNFIEEVFLHEGAHTSLDYDFGGVVDRAIWSEAVTSDGSFISGYAEEFPEREDISESYSAFLIWALHRNQGIFSESAAGIEALIPARLQYFESLGSDFGPLPKSCGT